MPWWRPFKKNFFNRYCDWNLRASAFHERKLEGNNFPRLLLRRYLIRHILQRRKFHVSSFRLVKAFANFCNLYFQWVSIFDTITFEYRKLCCVCKKNCAKIFQARLDLSEREEGGIDAGIDCKMDKGKVSLQKIQIKIVTDWCVQTRSKRSTTSLVDVAIKASIGLQ